jgi:hypothetical protein
MRSHAAQYASAIAPYGLRLTELILVITQPKALSKKPSLMQFLRLITLKKA